MIPNQAYGALTYLRGKPCPFCHDSILSQFGASGNPGAIHSCGPRGKSSKPDDGTNFNKNRADIPTTSHFVSVNAIRALPDTAHWRFKGLPPFRTRWTRADSALVIPYEGIPVTTEGYFEIVKTQSGGSGESPNCNANSESDTDWHITLVAHPSETEAQSVVVEPTKRRARLQREVSLLFVTMRSHAPKGRAE